jgi:hypothetical protein
MARRYRLLDPDIEKKHRARILEDEPNSLEPLVTRTPNVNWRIHPAWVPRYDLIMNYMSIFGLRYMIDHVFGHAG